MTENAPQWNPDFVPGNPLFEDLRGLFPHLSGSWPDASQLNRLRPPGLATLGGARIEFCRQTGPLGAMEYERCILESGRVPTRIQSWHDLFNALMWLRWGATKAQLNGISAADCASATGNRRSRHRDMTTLIDECGVVVAACDPLLEDLNREHRWEQLFLRQRHRWGREIRAFLIGHGLYEQSLRPHLGLTAKAVYVAVDGDFFGLGRAAQYRLLDRIVAQRLATDSALRSPADLHPFPVLGVPRWHFADQDVHFYRNAGYFRPRRVGPS